MNEAVNQGGLTVYAAWSIESFYHWPAGVAHFD
jgi:hypothetical protein